MTNEDRSLGQECGDGLKLSLPQVLLAGGRYYPAILLLDTYPRGMSALCSPKDKP